VSFILGWLYGGGMMAKVDKVKKTAYHFGMAFQIADDLGDLAQDEANQKGVNSAKILGPHRAYEMFQKEMKQYLELLEELGLNNSSFAKMTHMLSKAASTYAGDF